MVMAVISVCFGALSFLLPIPVVVPVIGLALGANSFIKERKKEPEAQQKRVRNTALAGMICCGLVVALVLVRQIAG